MKFKVILTRHSRRIYTIHKNHASVVVGIIKPNVWFLTFLFEQDTFFPINF